MMSTLKENDAKIMSDQLSDVQKQLESARDQIKKLNKSNKKYKSEYERKVC